MMLFYPDFKKQNIEMVFQKIFQVNENRQGFRPEFRPANLPFHFSLSALRNFSRPFFYAVLRLH
jgi:hypothetical protein